MEKQEEETKMNRTEFCKELCRLVLEGLGEGYQTEISQVQKNNGVLKEVVHVRKESSEGIPCFYMDELYHSYLDGECVDGMAEYLVNIVRGECERVRRDARKYLEKEWITGHLFLRLIHLDKNRDTLSGAVYRAFLDLAAVVYVLVEDSKDNVKSFRLPAYMWEGLGVGTIEEYFPKIVKNTERLFPARLSCMGHMASECILHGNEDGMPRFEAVQRSRNCRLTDYTFCPIVGESTGQRYFSIRRC